ncbi:MAG TPA: helix-turn-helix domain-containing protein [Candidatus Limnocylindria bacterium]|nr:helix-turn-helix domain-containing protein [Candidatus Limnocylindria bacterium]
MRSQRDAQLERAAVLADPVRRRVYDQVARAGRDVSRDEAARGARIGRALAAFHLDKLVAAGFLDATYRHLRGRAGPGAGRPSKVYRRARTELAITLPERRYEQLAHLLATAIEGSGSRALARAIADAARSLGERLGQDVRDAAGARADRDRTLSAAERVLARNGFEPYREAGAIRMRNCPYDALASEHRDLVCGLNLSLMEGLVGASGLTGVDASLEPGEGRCCVVLRRDR